MAEVWSFFSHEDDYPDLDEEAICRRLGRALAIPTVDGPSPEETNWAAFDELEEHFRGSFPYVFEAAEVEKVDHSLMLTIHGQDTSLNPVMFMGHMDVVPVVEGTWDDWTHGPFEGFVDDEYVWGRGAIDMTDQVMGELEAAEYALSHGWELSRTLIICLGQDEETFQTGARALGRLLDERGVTLEFLVDEGDYLIFDTGVYGVPGGFGMNVGLAEKGYADIRLTAHSLGGHSSNPYGGTSLARLARAIDRVAGYEWPQGLVEVDRETLAALSARITQEPLAGLVRGGRGAIDASADAICKLFLENPQLYPLVATTCAPTMIWGGSQQANVMPQDMGATINFRLLPGTTMSFVEKTVRSLVEDLDVGVELLANVSNDASHTSRADGPGFAALQHVAGRYFTDPETAQPLTLIPALMTGATDARMYERVCDSCLRFSAFVADADEVDRGVHGTDERITRRAYLQGIRFFIRLIEETML